MLTCIEGAMHLTSNIFRFRQTNKILAIIKWRFVINIQPQVSLILLNIVSSKIYVTFLCR